TEGHRILHLPHVKLAWEAWMQKADRAADIEPGEATIRHRQHLEALAHSNILDGSSPVADAQGNLRFQILPSAQWSTAFARAVKRIKQKETIRTIDAERNLTETTIELEFELHDKNAALRLEAQERGLAKGNKFLLPDGTEMETEGGIHVYQVNRFELPDNGRGPKPVAVANGAPSNPRSPLYLTSSLPTQPRQAQGRGRSLGRDLWPAVRAPGTLLPEPCRHRHLPRRRRVGNSGVVA